MIKFILHSVVSLLFCLISHYGNSQNIFGYEQCLTSVNYKYDLFGNTSSANCKDIPHNILNLPDQVNPSQEKDISFVYDARGNKLMHMQHNTKSAFNNQIHYVNNIKYHSIGNTMRIESVESETGYLSKNGSQFNSYYFITDHLLNTRAVFDVNSIHSNQSINQSINQSKTLITILLALN